MVTRAVMLLAASLAVIPLSCAQQDATAKQQKALQTALAQLEEYRRNAIQINELAGHIASPEDSRKLVDSIANQFADELPPRWATRSVRDRIARAEYESATDPSRLIPEQRVVDVWNEFVREIGAAEEAQVTVAELHTLRDGEYVSARVLWRRDMKSIWSVPGIYAVGSDGKLADGCRAVEVLRIIWEMANRFENLRGARENLQKGILPSEEFDRQEKLREVEGALPPKVAKSMVIVQSGVRNNPVETAAIQYIRNNGMVRFDQRVEKWIDALFQ